MKSLVDHDVVGIHSMLCRHATFCKGEKQVYPGRVISTLARYSVF
jgi:hypothetical protein